MTPALTRCRLRTRSTTGSVTTAPRILTPGSRKPQKSPGSDDQSERSVGRAACSPPDSSTAPRVRPESGRLLKTIAAELGDINRFASPRKLAGYSGLCPRVYQSGERDLRGPVA